MPTTAPPPQSHQHAAAVTAPLPRITIRFCTQCKWMLRAAYYAQELLSTFSLSLGEVALQPSTGGTFVVTIHHPSSSSSSSSPSPSPSPSIQSTTLWDRKTDGGFPETKELKRRVRDVIDPARDLGHVDRDHRAAVADFKAAAAAAAAAPGDAKDEENKELEKEPEPERERERKHEQDPSGSGVAVCQDCN
ncbi:seleno domain [Trichoderma cornu-damae]|uniref:Seleno domain n=1 Tax=Trichoderma cornu-damae TaxID=654480 RepID=A0A9P8QST4_9HYPO|nr:seleno domain [Trichoderma cornu-damae]